MKECVWWCWMITPVPGAVKITPAHDPNDYDVGMRLKLPFLTIITNDGNITKDCGEFAVSGCCCIVTTEIFSDEHLPCQPSDEHLPYWPSNEHLPCQPSDEHLPCQPQESWSSLNKKSWRPSSYVLNFCHWSWMALNYLEVSCVIYCFLGTLCSDLFFLGISCMVIYFCSKHCAMILFPWYIVPWFFFFSEDLVQWLFFLIIIDFFSEYLVLRSLLCMWHADFYWAFPFKLVCSCCVSSWPGHHLNIRS